MITYENLAKTPHAFRSLCGYSVAEFDALCRDWMAADQKARTTSRVTREGRKPRQRAVGAGRKYALDAPTRLVMTLVWLKVYPTWEVLGFLFGIHERTARREVRDVLEVVKKLARFPLEQRRPRKQGHNLAEVIEQFPAVEILIDSHEQRIRRPTGWTKQKPYYSGKKKAHTLKCQAAVSLTGRVQAISRSVPGSTSDPALLRTSGVLRKLKPGEGVGVDKGYVGIDKDHPPSACYVPYKKPPGGELTSAQKRYNRLLSRVRIKVEHFFGRLTRFGAMAQVWRHRRKQHTGVFRVAAYLVDRQLAAA
jgi:hypothetical protein